MIIDCKWGSGALFESDMGSLHITTGNYENTSEVINAQLMRMKIDNKLETTANSSTVSK